MKRIRRIYQRFQTVFNPIVCLLLIGSLDVPQVSAQLSGRITGQIGGQASGLGDFGLEGLDDAFDKAIEEQKVDQPVGPTDLVETNSGQLTGLKYADGLRVYRGIPYAAPPVAALRWKPPQPLQPWEGVRECNEFGSPAVQASDPSKGSEDCLYLNIWTKAKPGPSNAPVMIWIHGGGLNNGAGSLPPYDGAGFARRGAVLVTINYRLGPFGFLAHRSLSAESENGVSGNYGFLDQLAAIRWVRQNIRAFGGNPENVTVFGNSAGATSVYALAASPLSTGLFQRAILQSPWLAPNVYRHLKKDTWAGQSAESVSEAAVAKLVSNQADIASALRALPAATIAESIPNEHPLVVDGWFMPDFPQQIFARGDQQFVPVLIGTCQDEGTMFAPKKSFKSIAQFERPIREQFADQAQQVIDIYGVKELWKTRRAQIDYVGDTWFVHPAVEIADAVAESGATAYMYQFARKSLTQPHLGAAHGAEVPFVFNTLDRKKMAGMNQTVAVAMMAYWIRFASVADPNYTGLPTWPKYEIDDQQYLVIGGRFPVKSGLRQEACEIYDKVWATIRQ